MTHEVQRTDPRFVTVPIFAVSVIAFVVGQTLKQQSQNWKRFFSIAGGLGIAGVCCWHIVHPNPPPPESYHKKTPEHSSEEKEIETEEDVPPWVNLHYDPPPKTEKLVIPNNIKNFNPFGLRYRNNDAIAFIPIECIPGNLRVFLPTGTMDCVIELKAICEKPQEGKVLDPNTRHEIPKKWIEQIKNWPVSEGDIQLWKSICNSEDPAQIAEIQLQLATQKLKKAQNSSQQKNFIELEQTVSEWTKEMEKYHNLSKGNVDQEQEKIKAFRAIVTLLKELARFLASCTDSEEITPPLLAEMFQNFFSTLPQAEQKFVHHLVLLTQANGEELTVKRAFEAPFTDNLNKEKIQFLALSLWVLSKRLEPDPTTLDEEEKKLIDNTVPPEIRLCATALNCTMSDWFPEEKKK